MRGFRFLVFAAVGLGLCGACSEDDAAEGQAENGAEILLLKVDYTTNLFEGGQRLSFAQSPETFTVSTEYKEPGDFGWVKVYFSEIGELLFYGGIVWNGRGEIIYPDTWRDAADFERVPERNYVTPLNGFENIFNPRGDNYEYEFTMWSAVQSLREVRNLLEANPQQAVKLFLYTPSVGVGNPADWKWIILLMEGKRLD
jgi:hypothetical protein